jgi:hypothetical protein
MKKKPELNVMLDLETLGVSENSVVLSFALANFKLDDTAEDQPESVEIYARLPITPQVFAGREIDKDTVKWWSEKAPKESKEEVSKLQPQVSIEYLGLANDKNRYFDCDRDIEYALREVDNVLRTWATYYDIVIWSRGIDFDIPMFESLYKTFIPDYKAPWRYHSKRDVRTWLSTARYLGWDDTERTDNSHTALGDVRNQIGTVQRACSMLKDLVTPSSDECE